MDPTQLYETEIVNRDRDAPPDIGRAVRFVTLPARALAEGEVPRIEWLADELGLQQLIRPIEPWSAPFLFDAALGQYPDFPWVLEIPVPGARRRGEGPSRFAQYLVYEPVIPFESSPLQGVSLAKLLAGGGGAAGAAAGLIAGNLIVVLAVPAGIIIVGAAQGVAEALRIGIRAKLLGWMGVPDPDRPAEPEGGDG